MRVCVVGSCGKKKRTMVENAPNCGDLNSTSDLQTWKNQLKEHVVIARDMYLGNQSQELVKGVDILRSIRDVEVHLFIVSAGFGLLEEDEKVPPYECSFTGMKKSEIKSRSQQLSIPTDFARVCKTRYDLLYLALGKNYLTSIGDDWTTNIVGTVVTFDPRMSVDSSIFIPSGPGIVRAFSQQGHKIHGITGFKGDLLRILASYAINQDNPYHEVAAWTDPTFLQDLVETLSRTKARV
ncbi:MAG: hypothetical protein RTU92_06975 [Candidatus Thorarchaeota archaeon]